MDPETYLSAMGARRPALLGGQDLLVPDIAASLAGARRVWLPWRCSSSLVGSLRGCGFEVSEGNETEPILPPMRDAGCDAAYFGTPTLFGDTPLFPGWSPGWTYARERGLVRLLCHAARERGLLLLVSGLGSGSITPEEREADMGPGAEIVCVKRFYGFEDRVFVRRVRE